jgi:hypothetical protein
MPPSVKEWLGYFTGKYSRVQCCYNDFFSQLVMAQLVDALHYKTGGPVFDSLPIPVAERFKAKICGRSVAGIAGSNPAGCSDVCVGCCQQRQKGKIQDN